MKGMAYMFCSKCGKELAEGTVFCPSCGNPVNSVNQAAAADSPNVANSAPAKNEISAEEKTKKLVACGAFFFSMALELFFLWWIVGSKGRLILGNEYSEMFINKFWDELGWILIIPALFGTLNELFNAFMFYIIPYINRSFDLCYRKLVVCLVCEFVVVVMYCCGLFFTNDHVDFEDVISPVIVIGLLLIFAFKFVAAVDYRIAADCEYAAMLREKGTSIYAADTKPRNRKAYASKLASISGGEAREEYWECPECGARNRWLSDQCKDCGKYR